ncbi:MAG TPA: hypothetical protein VGY31_13690 [Terriglobia bacterium]|nr:hypothetical protein [Terriglobia bacterium]
MNLQELLSLPTSEMLRVGKLKCRLYPDVPSMIYSMARDMADEIQLRNERNEALRWILPVGPVAQYRELVTICNREQISWRNVFTFQMDEFLDWQGRPLPLDHPFSFEGFMRSQVFGKLTSDLRPLPDHTHFPSPFAPDAISEKIKEVGGVDTCFGGIGYHGHVAFNEPPISRWFRVTLDQLRNSSTRVVALGDDSIIAQSLQCAGGSCASVPPMAVTLGMSDILSSRRIRLYLAGGERHRTVLRIAMLQDPTTDYPCTLLQEHPDCILHTDEATARPIRPSLYAATGDEDLPA